MKHTPILLVLAAALLGSCSRGPEAPVASPPPPTEGTMPAAPGESLLAAAPANQPWYTQRFEALGFYVFPEPADIPPFTVQPRSGGAPVGPEELKGKITLLNFWATWCPPCRQEMPSIEILNNALKNEAFQVVAVSVREDSKTVDAFLKQNAYTFPIYLDPAGRASDNFVTRGIPTTFVLDKNAKAIAAIIGSRSYSAPEVIDLFRELARR